MQCTHRRGEWQKKFRVGYEDSPMDLAIEAMNHHVGSSNGRVEFLELDTIYLVYLNAANCLPKGAGRCEKTRVSNGF